MASPSDYLRKINPPEFRRGAGQPGQLAYGQATDLKRQVQAARATQSPGVGAAPQLPSPTPQGPAPGAPEPTFRPTTPDEKEILFTPTEFPDRPVVPLGRRMDPNEITAWLPYIRQMINSPTIPPAAREWYIQLISHIGPA